MSQETEWSDDLSVRVQETVVSSKTPAELKAAEAAVAEEWKEGDIILDLYEVKGVLGEGGFGKVYRVRHIGWNIDLAVKTPRLDRLDETGKENFRNEAETWVNLGLHPHTVSCYYVRDLGGIPRLFAEYVEGGSLSDWIRTRKLYEGGKNEALKRILDIGIQFAWGLHYAHEQGLVHRDVKPGNVMLTPEGVAKVTDFGLAKRRGITSDANGSIRENRVVVTDRIMSDKYASPEQSAGTPLSRKTDLWSWAVSMLEMFAREVTWMGGVGAADVLEEFVGPGSDHDSIPSLPRSVRNLLLDCFKSNPSDRPKDMMDIANQLGNIYQEITGRNFARQAPTAEKARIQETVFAQTPVDLSAREVAADEEWRIGDVILDLYQVKAVLGTGGFGKVYRVHHTGWNIDLAVKTPRINRLDEAAKENFRTEAETWVNLGLHPHTVSCYYVRDLGGIPRVFAEYVEGGTLSDWIRRRNLYAGGRDEALKRILDISIQFAWGLHYAHEQGLVHQDVKPGNVMMTPEGVAKVTDFGLAKARGVAGGEDGNTEGGSVLVASGGMTPAYASPEQSAGTPLSRKTDLWSWAVSVLEMFTGEVTWVSGVAAADVLEESVGATSDDDSIPSMPESIRSLLSACFKSSPSERPKDMMEVAIQLGNIYLEITGQNFTRQLPKAGKATAASLNNRALSLLDLGKAAEAISLWDEALQIEKHHLESTYNRGLVLWRAGQLGDDALAIEMRDVRASHGRSWIAHYLESLVHLERGDSEAAIRALENIQQGGNKAEIKAALILAEKRAAQLKQLEGHTADVNSVSLSFDGKYALSGSEDKTLKLWEVATGQCLRTLEAHTTLEDSVLSADGKSALFSGDKTPRLWEVATGRCLRNFERHTVSRRAVRFVSLTSDGEYALSSGDKTVQLWEVATGRCLRNFEGHSSDVESVSFSADGKYALSGSDDKTLKLWEVATGRCLRTFGGHTHSVVAVSLSADGKYALSGSWDHTVKLWEVTTGRCLRTFEGHTSFVAAVSLRADGKYALSGSWDKTMKLWEVATGRCLRTFEGHTGFVTSVSLSADGKFALSGRSDNSLILREIQSEYIAPFTTSQIVTSEATTQIEAEFEKCLALAREAFANGNGLKAATHIKHARSLTGRSRISDAVELWSNLYIRLPRMTLNTAWGSRTFEGHTRDVVAVSLSADGKYALSGSSDHTVKLWEVTTGRCLRTFEGHTSGVESISLSADGKHALSCEETTMRLWEVATGRCVRTFEGHTSYVAVVSLSADGKYALSGSWDRTLKLWEVATGRCLRTFEGHTYSVKSVSFSADGKCVLSGSEDETMKLWEVATGRCLRTFGGHTGYVRSVSLSADGKYAVSGSYKMLKLWEAATGRCLRTFEGHTGFVTSVSLSADGKYALSGSSDKTMKLWEFSTGRCLRTFEGNKDSTLPFSVSVSLSADGKYALSGMNETLKLWLLDWELDDREPADWDEGARAHLQTFLVQQTPYAYSIPRDGEPTEEEITLALTRRGKPTWSEDDFQRLLYTLGCGGYGWLRPEGVRRELEKMASET